MLGQTPGFRNDPAGKIRAVRSSSGHSAGASGQNILPREADSEARFHGLVCDASHKELQRLETAETLSQLAFSPEGSARLESLEVQKSY